VLEEMRESGAAGALVLRTDVVPEVDGDERSGVVFVEYDAESIIQTIVFEGEHGGGYISQG
jgi:hypothetical protein